MKTTVKAYAKINFILKVLGDLPNGYHKVDMVMQAVELCDVVDVSVFPASQPVIRLKPGKPFLPSDEKNLAYKAALLMKEKYRPEKSESIYINVEKNIPVAAGLAGGSADGAAVVTALARLWKLIPGTADREADMPLDVTSPVFEELKEICAKLGADVPFCFMAQNGLSAGIATGTGTDVTPIEPAQCSILMVTPKIPVSTKEVYDDWSMADNVEKSSTEGFIANRRLIDKIGFMGNDLQAPCLRKVPQLAEIFDLLEETGKPLATQLSGSGPTVFNVYEAGTQAPDLTELNRLDAAVNFTRTLI